ncbi:dUTP diphosphatase, partial [Candidatus Woesebacteria bacterium]|nr:dUTP diphosphatase [Candidatus Woesebacteria bacterium]
MVKAAIHLPIKLFDTTLPLPEYQTGGAAGFDLCSRLDTDIPPGEVVLVPLNIAIQLPEGYWAMVAARSSLHKLGLQLVN